MFFDKVYKAVKVATGKDDLAQRLQALEKESCLPSEENRDNVTSMTLFIRDFFTDSIIHRLVKEKENEKIAWLLELSKTPQTIEGLNSSIAAAHASLGNLDYTKEYLATPGINKDILPLILLNSVKGGIAKEILPIIQEKSPDDSHELSLCTYAMLNDHKKVEEYSSLAKSAYVDKTSRLSSILAGYIYAGNEEKINFYLNAVKKLPEQKKKKIYGSMLDVYTFKGNYKKIEEFRKAFHIKCENIFDNVVTTGDLDKAEEYNLNYFLDRYLMRRTNQTDKLGKTKDTLWPFFTSHQKSFNEKSAAIAALKSALKGEEVNLIIHLPILRDGRLGKGLRSFIKAGKADELLDDEKVNVTTVSDFITALHEQVNSMSTTPQATR